MSVAELDIEYKQKWAELKTKLGREPDSRDKEYWELTEWHRACCEEHKAPSVKEKDPIEVIVEVKQPVAAKAANLCRVCGAEIPPSGKRGRPAVKCDKCKAEGK